MKAKTGIHVPQHLDDSPVAPMSVRPGCIAALLLVFAVLALGCRPDETTEADPPDDPYTATVQVVDLGDIGAKAYYVEFDDGSRCLVLNKSSDAVAVDCNWRYYALEDAVRGTRKVEAP